jgi:hypothetical protein
MAYSRHCDARVYRSEVKQRSSDDLTGTGPRRRAGVYCGVCQAAEAERPPANFICEWREHAPELRVPQGNRGLGLGIIGVWRPVPMFA